MDDGDGALLFIIFIFSTIAGMVLLVSGSMGIPIEDSAQELCEKLGFRELTDYSVIPIDNYVGNIKIECDGNVVENNSFSGWHGYEKTSDVECAKTDKWGMCTHTDRVKKVVISNG